MTNWTQFRAKFPALEGKAYLNTAGGGVMSHQVAKAATQYFKESVEQGDICWNTWLARADRDRVDVGKFIGADSISVAFLQNASLGLNIVARSFESNIEVLAIKPEFPSCTTPFLRAGHTVNFMDTTAVTKVGSKGVMGLFERVSSDLFLRDGVYSLWSLDTANPVETAKPPGNNLYGTHPIYMGMAPDDTWFGVYTNLAAA